MPSQPGGHSQPSQAQRQVSMMSLGGASTMHRNNSIVRGNPQYGGGQSDFHGYPPNMNSQISRADSIGGLDRYNSSMYGRQMGYQQRPGMMPPHGQPQYPHMMGRVP